MSFHCAILPHTAIVSNYNLGGGVRISGLKLLGNKHCRCPGGERSQAPMGERALTREKGSRCPRGQYVLFISLDHSYHHLCPSYMYVLCNVKPEIKYISQHHQHAYIIVLLLNMYQSFEWMYDTRSGSPLDDSQNLTSKYRSQCAVVHIISLF